MLSMPTARLLDLGVTFGEGVVTLVDDRGAERAEAGDQGGDALAGGGLGLAGGGGPVLLLPFDKRTGRLGAPVMEEGGFPEAFVA